MMLLHRIKCDRFAENLFLSLHITNLLPLTDITKRMTKNRGRGRPKGYSPVSSLPIVKGRKAWAMEAELWEWLEAQPNQAAVLREAIALLKYKKERS
ncbi:hypothetical protein VF04_04090 [Nostoc linckia z7]|uniref:Uncharacterized protein n=2 Tax=Nostoc linckia TaxID=92942 RepID=A0A9Q5ZGE0_NOSLI|nr:hypothetical protein [Nostoc linckia]PHK42893.1 hypothetical protein VF12_00790 [Nostoc linckia z15]PHK48050.1 hypothetical protein VF13_01765 [Nostoc linckia z16]PHJ64970.1 hypothetical protein VF02_11575 [Nostoc linckia z1]PHJ70148.1 hypothetical protein VF05_11735 [Nostoc linckia z3]PHJ75049.1 hypothetical protein VF03_11895 [Nostoc linckia z2]